MERLGEAGGAGAITLCPHRGRAVTPRPIYKADGRKLPDCYTVPAELRDELTRELGPFRHTQRLRLLLERPAKATQIVLRGSVKTNEWIVNFKSKQGI